jgi:membrane protein CcdC involved in cytochrome C biogenesis
VVGRTRLCDIKFGGEKEVVVIIGLISTQCVWGESQLPEYSDVSLFSPFIFKIIFFVVIISTSKFETKRERVLMRRD